MNDNTKDIQTINFMRGLAIDQVNNAQIGHSGMAIAAMPVMYSLFKNHICWDTEDSDWVNRDRFILSAGHGSAMLYTVLFMLDYLSMDDLRQFRKLNSKTPGHPENTVTKGVDYTTGPLGQGVAMSVGAAVTETYWRANYEAKNSKSPINYHTYVMCGDGDLQEGVALESIALAGTWKLDKLTLLYDSNDIQLDGKTSECTSTDIKKYFESNEWHYQLVKDSENMDEVNKAIENAKQSKKPSIIEIKSIIGLGSPIQNTNKAHGAILNEQADATKTHYKLKKEPFCNEETLKNNFLSFFNERNSKNINQWKKTSKELLDVFPEIMEIYTKGMFPVNRETLPKDFMEEKDDQLRNISIQALKLFIERTRGVVVLNADLGSSTKIVGTDIPYSSTNRNSNYLKTGVREFAMTAIANGIVGTRILKAVTSSFLVFSDYTKPALRLGALSKFPVVNIFSHDSVWVGTDGPTHQPIEQFAMIRSTPNLYFLRPSNLREMIEAMGFGFFQKSKPVFIATSRQKVKVVKTPQNAVGIRGAYVIHKASEKPQAIIISTGSEVSTAVEIAKEIQKEKHWEINVVSMLCMKLFDKQIEQYKNSVITPEAIKISYEIATTFGWHKYIGSDGLAIGVDSFGGSAKEEDLIKKLELDKESVKKKIISHLEGKI